MKPLPAILLLALPLLTACSAPRVNNTRLGSADLVAMTDAMAASLLNADAIAGRTAASPPWIVTLDRVSNRTNHVIPANEQWAFMARLRAMLSQSDALAARNLRFVMSADRLDELGIDRKAGGALAPGSRNTNPTHVLGATFYSATTRTREGRTDAYLCAFKLLDADDDRVLWEDSYEVKHAVVRHRLD